MTTTGQVEARDMTNSVLRVRARRPRKWKTFQRRRCPLLLIVFSDVGSCRPRISLLFDLVFNPMPFTRNPHAETQNDPGRPERQSRALGNVPHEIALCRVICKFIQVCETSALLAI
jgi:hypothetical protein